MSISFGKFQFSLASLPLNNTFLVTSSFHCSFLTKPLKKKRFSLGHKISWKFTMVNFPRILYFGDLGKCVTLTKITFYILERCIYNNLFRCCIQYATQLTAVSTLTSLVTGPVFIYFIRKNYGFITHVNISVPDGP